MIPFATARIRREIAVAADDNNIDFKMTIRAAAEPAHAPIENDADGAETGIVEFVCAPGLESRIPLPERAVRFAPHWFKNLERDMGVPNREGLPGLTAKACLPMTDAFSAGFIIPLPFDVRLVVPDDRVSIQMGWADDLPFAPIEQHHPGQIGAPNPPFEQTMPLKFMNPWRIKTPAGYSALFTHPFNHFELPFTAFTGLVDCDRFDAAINFPFAWTGAPGDYTLPAGAPIIQLIPIRRDTLLKHGAARASTAQEQAEQTAATKRKYGEESVYARDWRVKKS